MQCTTCESFIIFFGALITVSCEIAHKHNNALDDIHKASEIWSAPDRGISKRQGVYDFAEKMQKALARFRNPDYRYVPDFRAYYETYKGNRRFIFSNM